MRTEIFTVLFSILFAAVLVGGAGWVARRPSQRDKQRSHVPGDGGGRAVPDPFGRWTPLSAPPRTLPACGRASVLPATEWASARSDRHHPTAR